MNQFDEHHYRFPRSTREAFGSLEPMRKDFKFHNDSFPVWPAVGVVLIILAVVVLLG